MLDIQRRLFAVQSAVSVELRSGNSEEGTFQDVPFDEGSDGFHFCVLDDDVVARLDVDPLGSPRAGAVEVDQDWYLSPVRQFANDDGFAGADGNVAVQCGCARASAVLLVIRFGDRDGFQNVEVAVARKRVLAPAEQATGVEVFVVSRGDEDDVAVLQNDVTFAEVDCFVLIQSQRNSD